jgi:hypothetical protein
VELEDGLVTPAWVNVLPLENRRWAFEVCIREGKTREVRRLCAALGLEVEHLMRTQFGPVRIGQLAPGSTRALTGREIAMLEALTGLELGVDPPTMSQRRRERERHDRDRRTSGGGGGSGGGAPARRPSRESRGEGSPSRPSRGGSAREGQRGRAASDERGSAPRKPAGPARRDTRSAGPRADGPRSGGPRADGPRSGGGAQRRPPRGDGRR